MEIFKLFGSILVDSAQAEQSISRTGQQAEGMGGKLGKGIKTAAIWGGALVSAAVAVGGKMVAMAGEFDKSFAKVSTLLDSSVVDYDKYKKEILDASSESGVAVNDFAEAVYSSISAGVDQTKAIEFTTDAMKLAKGGFTDGAKAVDVITTALNGYKMGAEDAGKVSDLLITTQNLGKTTVDELASSMGKVIPIASASNFSIEELSASYATLTKNGIATAEAGTYMKSMLNELTKSGSTTDKALRGLTGKGFAELKAEGKSTTEILAMLDKEAQGNGKSLKDMFGSAEAGSAALVMMSQGGAEYNEILASMQESAGATDEAFSKVTSSLPERMDKIKNSMTNSAIEIGTALLPLVEGAVAFVEKNLPYIQKGIEVFVDQIKAFIKALSEFWKENGEQITEIAKVAFEAIKGIIETAMKAIKGIIDVVLGIIDGDWEKVFSGLASIVKNIMELNKKLIDLGMKAIANIIKGFAKVLYNAGKAAFESVWNGMKDIWGSISGWVSDKVSWLADKLAFWRKSNSEMDDDGGKKKKTSGSHAGGLPFVPFDGYVAELHRGERVVTASNNTDIGESLKMIAELLKNGGGPGTIIVQIGSKEIVKEITPEISRRLAFEAKGAF